MLFILARREHHQVVVSLQGHTPAALPQRQYSIQDPTGVWTTVNVVAKQHDQVIGLRVNLLQDHIQRALAPVDVSDRKRPHVLKLPIVFTRRVGKWHSSFGH
jgi:hypothetical protein